MIKTRKKKANATFKFTSSEARSRFECRLDDGAYEPCESPHTVNVSRGPHIFRVRAIDEAENVDESQAERAWRVKKKR